jgi:mannose-6-phosphate isomerase-like protein (cupin superfamily)
MDIRLLAQVYDLAAIDALLADVYWSPIDVARINDWMLRAAAIKGEYHWHSHQDDELFLVHKGEMTIDTEKGPIFIKEGEGAVIPKGLRHKPQAVERTIILMLEPMRLKSQGD